MRNEDALYMELRRCWILREDRMDELQRTAFDSTAYNVAERYATHYTVRFEALIWALQENSPRMYEYFANERSSLPRS